MTTQTKVAVFGMAALCAMLLVLGMFGFIQATPQTAYAAGSSGKAYASKLRPYTVYTSYDITGDGKRDKIEIYPTAVSEQSDLVSDLSDNPAPDSDLDAKWARMLSFLRAMGNAWDEYTSLYVYVNDKLALRKVNLKDYPTVDALEVYFVKLANGKRSLFLATHGRSDVANVCGMFNYRGGKLRQTLNVKAPFPKKYVNSGQTTFFKKVSGNTVTLTYQASLRSVGGCWGDVKYTYKSGKFVRKGSTFKIRLASSAQSGKPHEALRKLAVYKTPSGKSKKFVIQKGDKVKILKCYLKNSKVAFKVKVGKRTGWIRCASRSRSNLLYNGLPPFQGLTTAG